MKFVRYTLGWLGLLSVGLASAQIYTAHMECHYCTESNYESMALSAGIGVHQILDMGHDQVRVYEVACPNQPPMRPDRRAPVDKLVALVRAIAITCPDGPPRVQSLPVEPEILQAIPALGAYWRSNGGSFNKARHDVDIAAIPGGPESGWDSVYDLHGARFFTDDDIMIRWLTDQGGISFTVAQSIAGVTTAVAMRIIGAVASMETMVTIRVNFPDGSYREYSCPTRSYCTGAVSRDSDEQLVPTRSDIADSFETIRKDDHNARKLVSLIREYGIPVCRDDDCNVAGTASVGDPMQLRCVQRGSGLICFLVEK